MTTATTHHELSSTHESGLIDRVGERMRQFICGLHGHDVLMHFERDRLSLVCTSCNYESPGWDVRRAPRHLRANTPTVSRMPLVSEHRVA